MCHVLLLMPILALPLFIFLPREQSLPLYGAVWLLAAAVYWLAWTTLRRPASTGIEGMIGGRAKVFQGGDGKTKVLFHGEIWDVESGDRLFHGDRVEIVGLARMKLIVRLESKS